MTREERGVEDVLMVDDEMKPCTHESVEEPDRDAPDATALWRIGCRIVLPALVLGLALAGCRQDGHRGRVPPGVEPRGATIGHDLRAWPSGESIPVTGLGVDLVDARASSRQVGFRMTDQPRTDSAIRPAEASAPRESYSRSGFHPLGSSIDQE